jgi:thyroxine 5-deiodinase
VSYISSSYTRQAHANDEWPLGDKFSWRQHRTLEERTELAKLFKQDMQYQLPMYVDLMDNTFERVFAAWPERYYIVLNGKVMYKSMPRDESMHFDEVVAWLDEFRKTGVTSA